MPLLLLDTDVEDNPDHYATSPTGSTAATPSTGCARRCCSASAASARSAPTAGSPARPAPEVFHTNEGHAGFLGLERIRELTVAEGGPSSTSTPRSRSAARRTVFTTHTPVPAGIDRFPRDLVEQYFGGDSAAAGVPVDRILALGAEDYEGGDPAVFNMAVMGFRLAQRANGVSQLHGEVSRGMFGGLWPAFDEAEVPIGSITNGVHAPTWVAREVFDLAVDQGADADGDDAEAFWAAVDKVPGQDIWAVKRLLRERLVDDARTPAARARGSSAAPPRPSSAGSTPRSTPTCSPSGSRAACRRTSGSR